MPGIGDGPGGASCVGAGHVAPDATRLNRPGRLPTVIGLVVALALCAPPLLVDLPGHPYHVDEAAWVWSTFYYRLFFRERNLTAPAWSTGEAKGRPPVAKYTLGMGLDLAGCVSKVDPARLFTWWRRSRHFPAVNSCVDAECLLAARTTSALLALGAALVLFWIGCQVSGPLAGTLMSVGFAYHPVILLACRRAGAESTLLLFSLLAVLAQVHFLPALTHLEGRPHRTALFIAAESICLAGAVGSKLNGALVALSFVITMAVLCAMCAAGEPAGARDPVPGRRRFARCTRLLVVTLAVGVCAFLLLVVFDPWLHPSPLKRFLQMWKSSRAGLLSVAGRGPGGALTTLGSRAGFVLSATLRGRGVWVPSLATALGQGALMTFGFVILSVGALSKVLRGRATGELPLWVWIVTSFVVVTAWVPVPWERLLAPLVPGLCCLLGLSLAHLVRCAPRWHTRWAGANTRAPERRVPWRERGAGR